ncbi:hypothetical protein X975_26195, partial [Stegodyphus mimosarum]
MTAETLRSPNSSSNDSTLLRFQAPIQNAVAPDARRPPYPAGPSIANTPTSSHKSKGQHT